MTTDALPIPGFPAYSATRTGTIIGPRGVLTPSASTGGYQVVRLHNPHGFLKKITRHVHRLVAEAFIPNPLNFPVVHHRNGNRSDNRVENLEWLTYQQNQADATYGPSREPRRLTDEERQEISRLASDGVADAEIAHRLGIGRKFVAMVLIGTRWQPDTVVVEDSPEEWRPCASFPRYEVSSHGRFRRGDRLLAPIVNRKLGYVLYKPRKDMKTYQEYGHRLVALTFIGPPPEGMKNPRVNHRNHDRTDNRVGNLEWVPHAENIQKRYVAYRT